MEHIYSIEQVFLNLQNIVYHSSIIIICFLILT